MVNAVPHAHAPRAKIISNIFGEMSCLVQRCMAYRSHHRAFFLLFRTRLPCRVFHT